MEADSIRGDVLDAGCGTGENAIYLAERGHHVVAFDAAPAAIEKARAKAAQRLVEVTFEVADERDLPPWESRFGTIIDSGLFHVMARSADRLRYTNGLKRVSLPGAVLHLLGFREQRPRWLSRFRTCLRTSLSGFGTHGISVEELRSAFRDGWNIDAIEEVQYGWGRFLLAHIRRVI